MSALYFKKLRKQQNNELSSDEDSDSDDEVPKVKTLKKASASKPVEEKYDHMNDLFVIDRNEEIDESKNEINTEVIGVNLLNNSHLEPYVMEKDLKQLLEKAIVGPKFETSHQPQARLLGKNAAARLRKAEREKTKGSDWFNLPATEITEETKRDLELLKMRRTLDPLAHYRRNDRNVLPKYFQVGHVVDAPEDFYSSRMLKKERKRTMVDELLYNEDVLAKTKKRFSEERQKALKRKRGGFQKFGNKKLNKQKREAKK